MNYIGQFVELEIARFTSVGAFLSDNQNFEVLLPNKYLTDNMELNQTVEVFIYNDSEDRPVATTEIPKIKLNDFAFLDVKSITSIGAFLDWGLEKDLLVPFKEQQSKMVEGGNYLVYLLLDERTNRLIGSAKINQFLDNQTRGIEQGDEIEIFVAETTDLGMKVIVNHRFQGLIFKDRLVKPLEQGDRMTAYAEFIRQDGKIDVSLVPIGNEKFDIFTIGLLQYLNQNNGVLNLTDKSSPELIRKNLGMSKKSFKKAVGNLYKQRKIKILEDKIELIVSDE